MTDDEMLALGERIATGIVRVNLDSATKPELARLSILVAHQLMLMGQLFAEEAGLDVGVVHREEFVRASTWHDRILAIAAATPRA